MDALDTVATDLEAPSPGAPSFDPPVNFTDEPVEHPPGFLPDPADEEPAAPAPEAAMTERLAALEARISDRDAALAASENRRVEVEGRLSAEQGQMARIGQMLRQQQDIPQPNLVKEAMDENPEQELARYSKAMSEWTLQVANSRFGPALQELQRLQQESEQNGGLLEDTARGKAASAVKDSLGFDDFDTLYPEIQQRMMANGARHMLRDPKQLRLAYIVLRDEKGMPMAPASSARPSPSPSSPVSASARHGRNPKLAALQSKYSPMAASVARGLGIAGISMDRVEDFSELERV